MYFIARFPLNQVVAKVILPEIVGTCSGLLEEHCICGDGLRGFGGVEGHVRAFKITNAAVFLFEIRAIGECLVVSEGGVGSWG